MTHKGNTVEVQDFFNERAKSYNRLSRWALDETLNVHTDQFLLGLSGRVALEVGSGTGILISRVQNFEAKVALDISREMLEQIKDTSIKKIIGDVHKLELPAGYADLIICRQILHYCNLPLALQNIKRVLARNGSIHVVQVVDVEGVPSTWDQEWAGFRNIADRKHLRRKELEKCFEEHSLRAIKRDFVTLSDRYTWTDFFTKNNISKSQESKVRRFFEDSPDVIARKINLQCSTDGLAYDRLFGFWLLRT